MSKETLSTSETEKTETPKIKLALQEKYEEENKEEVRNMGEAKEPLHPDNIGTETVDQLPIPVGYRILVLPFTPKEKTKGGILFLKNL